jgi:hypothetical protein
MLAAAAGEEDSAHHNGAEEGQTLSTTSEAAPGIPSTMPPSPPPAQCLSQAELASTLVAPTPGVGSSSVEPFRETTSIGNNNNNSGAGVGDGAAHESTSEEQGSSMAELPSPYKSGLHSTRTDVFNPVAFALHLDDSNVGSGGSNPATADSGAPEAFAGDEKEMIGPVSIRGCAVADDDSNVASGDNSSIQCETGAKFSPFDPAATPPGVAAGATNVAIGGAFRAYQLLGQEDPIDPQTPASLDGLRPNTASALLPRSLSADPADTKLVETLMRPKATTPQSSPSNSPRK